tara:strand:- start:693 stop:917 length:225 start_codon:yes stop_codon:yes gene_type:complete
MEIKRLREYVHTKYDYYCSLGRHKTFLSDRECNEQEIGFKLYTELLEFMDNLDILKETKYPKVEHIYKKINKTD